MEELVFDYDIEYAGKVSHYGTDVPHIKIKKTKIKNDPAPITGEMMLSEYDIIKKIKELVAQGAIQPNDASALVKLIEKYGEDSYQSGYDIADLNNSEMLAGESM